MFTSIHHCKFDLKHPKKLINWRRIPIVKIIIPYILGILIAQYFVSNIVLQTSLPILFFVSFLAYNYFFRKSNQLRLVQVNGIFLMVVILVFAWARTLISNEQVEPLTEKTGYLKVEVESLSTTKKGDKLKAEVQLLNGNFGKAICYFPIDSTLTESSVLVLKNKLKPISSVKNPLAFDYGNYLRNKGIYYQGFFNDKDYKWIENSDNFSLKKWSKRLRNTLLKTLKENKVTESQYAIAAALLLGDKSALDDDLKEAYSVAGAMHVLAVSGLHVGIVFMLLQFLMGRYKNKSKQMRWWEALISILFLWFFALLTGMGPSVIRASTMFSFVVIGQAMNRRVSIYNIIAASALLLLIIDPKMIFEVGFQLSYLAVIGIIYFQPKIANWFYVRNKYLDYVWQLTAVSIAAQISTLPITLYYFHSFPTYFFLTNLLVIPAASVVIALGVIVLITSFIPVVSSIFGVILNLVLVWLNKGVFFISLLPGSKISGISIGEVEVLLLYSIIVLGAVAFYSKSGRYLIATLITLLLLIVLDIQEDIRLLNEHKIIVWNTNKQSTISAIGENNCIYTTEDEYADLKYPLGNYYAAHDIKLEPIFEFASESIHVFHLNDKKVVVIPQKHSIKIPEKKFKTDILLVTQNCPLSLQTLTQQFDFETIIFDASNSEYTAKRYCDEAVLLDLHYINTRETGAFVLDLK